MSNTTEREQTVASKEMETAESRAEKLLEDAQNNLILAQECVIAAQGALFEARHRKIMERIEESPHG